MRTFRLSRAFRVAAIAAIVVVIPLLPKATSAQSSPNDATKLLTQLMRFGIDGAGVAGTVDVVAPGAIGGPVQILFDVPSTIEVPLALVSAFASPPGSVTAAEFTNGASSSTHMSLPVQVCVQFDAQGAAALGRPELEPDLSSDVAASTVSANGGKTGLLPSTEEENKSELSKLGLACPSGWMPITSAATLAAATVPLPRPAPLELSAASLSDVAGEVTEEVTLTMRLLLQTRLPGDNAPVVSKEFDVPPVTVPVPQLPIPDIGFAFGGKEFGKEDNWFGLAVAVPAGSALGSTADAFALVDKLTSIVAKARKTLAFATLITPVDEEEVTQVYDELQGAFDAVLRQESLPDGTEFAGVAFVEGNDEDLGLDGWVDRREGFGGSDDPGISDDVRSAVVFAPSYVWCWYENNFDGDDHALHANAAAPFVRLYPDVGAEFGDKFKASGESAVPGGSDSGVSSWQWFRSDDRTGFADGFPVTVDNESSACRTGGHDRTAATRVAR